MISGSILGGVKNSGMSIEAYSSMTMRRGSFPHSFARLWATTMPRIKSIAAVRTYNVLWDKRRYQRTILIEQENVAGATGK